MLLKVALAIKKDHKDQYVLKSKGTLDIQLSEKEQLRESCMV